MASADSIPATRTLSQDSSSSCATAFYNTHPAPQASIEESAFHTEIESLVDEDTVAAITLTTLDSHEHDIFQDEQYDSDDSFVSAKSESLIMDTTTIEAPALPERSRARASRLLATIPIKSATECTILTHAAPHMVYLSSEEDGSSSADDFSDFDLTDDEDADGVRRGSHEDIARIVSVVYSGKPSIVSLPARSTSPSIASTSDDGRPKTSSGLMGRASISSLSRTLSFTSTASPARTSSRMTRPSFLKIDPFATKAPESEDTERPKTPKSASSLFRNMGLGKKRSKASLSTFPRDGEISPLAQVGEEEELDSISALQGSTYSDIMKAAKRKASTSTLNANPSSPSGKNFFAKRLSVRV